MSKEIKLTKEFIQKAKEAKSAEELKALVQENNVELSDEQIAVMFCALSADSNISDNELVAVVGGNTSSTSSDKICPTCGGTMVKVPSSSGTGYVCIRCSMRSGNATLFI